MIETLIVPRQFNGPPDSGHGGYACGAFASLIDEDAAEVTLRRPIPLDTPLAVTRPDAKRATISLGSDLIAEVCVAAPEVEVPSPPSLEEAAAAERAYRGFIRHEFPTCFGCGSARAEGDALRLFTGSVAGRNMVAARWSPPRAFADTDGTMPKIFIWAALDCPSGWAVLGPKEYGPILLGRFTAVIKRPLKAGDRSVVVGWPIARDGRKLHAGAAIFDGTGSLVAAGRALWFKP